jgi:hypothetical protein
MLTKKHFEKIAEVISNHLNEGSGLEAEHIADDLSSYFAEDNPLFDRARFLKACGIKRGDD